MSDTINYQELIASLEGHDFDRDPGMDCTPFECGAFGLCNRAAAAIKALMPMKEVLDTIRAIPAFQKEDGSLDAQKLVELCQLEQEGRVHRLYCAPDTPVWEVTPKHSAFCDASRQECFKCDYYTEGGLGDPSGCLRDPGPCYIVIGPMQLTVDKIAKAEKQNGWGFGEMVFLSEKEAADVAASLNAKNGGEGPIRET